MERWSGVEQSRQSRAEHGLQGGRGHTVLSRGMDVLRMDICRDYQSSAEVKFEDLRRAEGGGRRAALTQGSLRERVKQKGGRSFISRQTFLYSCYAIAAIA